MKQLLLLLAVVGFGDDVREERVRDTRAGRAATSGTSYAFFEFAPPDGTGMGAACACAAPTGAKGEVLTFSRASSASCLKGNTTASIAPGDLVTCTTDQPRVMPGGDGSGGLGLMVEETRTNSDLQSEHFENAAWTKETGITVSANDVNCPLAPDGTQTMDLVTFNGANSTGLYQNVTGSSGVAYTNSVFLVRKTGGAACVLGVGDGATGGSNVQVTVASTMGRFSSSFTSSTTSGGLYLKETTAGDCVDACVWGGDHELGAFVTSYIQTTSAAATRAAEVGDVAVTFGGGTTGIAMAATSVSVDLGTRQSVLIGTLGDRAPGVATGSAAYFTGQYSSTKLIVVATNPPSSVTSYDPVLPFSAGVNRVTAFNSGATINGCVNGTCGAGTAATWTAPAFLRFRVGSYASATNVLNGVSKRVCIDTYASGNCRQ